MRLFPVTVALRQWGEQNFFAPGEQHSELVDSRKGQPSTPTSSPARARRCGCVSGWPASEIAESRPDLEVAVAVRGGLGDWLSEKAKVHLHEAFDRLGIARHEHADIAGVGPTGATTAGGRVIPAEVTVWAAGFAVHPIAAATTLQVSESGQVVVDDTMRSVSHPDVYAVGDAALAPGVNGNPLRMSCASGVPTAHQAADAITARLTGGRVPRNKIGYSGQCVSLGRHDALVQWVTPDDQVKPGAVTGRMAVRIKETICRVAAWSVAHPTYMFPTRRRHTVPTDDTRTVAV